MSSRNLRKQVLRHRAGLSEGTGMVRRHASLEARSDVLGCGGGPPILCAIAARQPWIDRISDRFFERPFGRNRPPAGMNG